MGSSCVYNRLTSITKNPFINARTWIGLHFAVSAHWIVFGRIEYIVTNELLRLCLALTRVTFLAEPIHLSSTKKLHSHSHIIPAFPTTNESLAHLSDCHIHLKLRHTHPPVRRSPPVIRFCFFCSKLNVATGTMDGDAVNRRLLTLHLTLFYELMAECLTENHLASQMRCKNNKNKFKGTTYKITKQK